MNREYIKTNQSCELKLVCQKCDNDRWVIRASGYECSECGMRARDCMGADAFKPVNIKNHKSENGE